MKELLQRLIMRGVLVVLFKFTERIGFQPVFPRPIL